MTIAIDKSPLASSDPQTTKALQHVLDRLEVQSEHVKNVHVLANFSIDKLATLKHGRPIVQGIVVQVDKQYTMSIEDQSWFHPEIASGRSVFQVKRVISAGALSKLSPDGLHSSIGAYTSSLADDFGCETVQHHVIVDTSATESLHGLYQKWLNTGATAGDIDKQWKRMSFGESDGIVSATEKMRVDIAKGITKSAELIYSDTTHSVLSDSSSVYFTNNVVKQSKGINLIKSSALGGYRTYKCNNESVRFLPASLGQASGYYSWSDMSPQNCARIEKACSWDGALVFNANVMTPPSITGSKIREMEDAYELSFRDSLTMNTARFSPSDQVRDAMSPTDILSLTPNSEHVSTAQSFITAPVDIQHPVLRKLMENIQQIQVSYPEIQIFNPKLVENGRLKIPKSLYKDLVEKLIK